MLSWQLLAEIHNNAILCVIFSRVVIFVQSLSLLLAFACGGYHDQI
jgi:hypothetical protein